MGETGQKLVQGVIGGVVAGFSIGVGFLIAQRMLSKWGYKHQLESNNKPDIASEIKQGVKEGVKEAKTEEQAAQFAAMNAEQGAARKGKRSAGKVAQSMFVGFNGKESEFEGNPNKMSFSGNPMDFGSTPNGSLNSF